MFVMSENVMEAKLRVVRNNPVGTYVNSKNDSYDICENPCTQGLMCVFKHNGEWYFVDLSFIDDLGKYECAIFHSDMNGEVENWKPLVMKHFEYDEKKIFGDEHNFETNLKYFHALRSKDLCACINDFVGERLR